MRGEVRFRAAVKIADSCRPTEIGLKLNGFGERSAQLENAGSVGRGRASRVMCTQCVAMRVARSRLLAWLLARNADRARRAAPYTGAT